MTGRRHIQKWQAFQRQLSEEVMAPLSANERRQLVKLLDRIRIEGTQRVAGGDVGIHDGPLQTPDGDIPPTGRAVSNRSAASVASAGWGKRSSTCNRTNALCRFKESDYARPHTIGWLLKPLRRRPRTHTQTFSRHCSTARRRVLRSRGRRRS